MKLHANAALSVNRRRRLCERVVDGWTVTEAAEAADVSVRTAREWRCGYRAEGEAGLLDRPSTPRRQPTRTSEQRVQAIAALRRVRLTAAQIAEALSMPLSTVSGILTRIGLGKRSRLEPPERPNRYERRHPGELIHVDVKKLGRIERGAGHRVTGHRHTHVGRDGERHVGWEYVHVCIDDATRLAYVEVLADEGRHRDRLSSPRARVLRRARHPRAAPDDRQRPRLRLPRSCAGLPRPRAAPPPRAALPPAHQRKGGALHPNAARRLGLRRHLRQLPAATRCAVHLARALQLPTTPRRPQPPPAGSPRRAADREQPPRSYTATT